MPNTASAAKRMRQALKRRLRNKAVESRMKTMIKKATAAIESGDSQAIGQLMASAASAIDKAAAKGVIHRNQAARRKSRLAKRLAKAQAGAAQANQAGS